MSPNGARASLPALEASARCSTHSLTHTYIPPHQAFPPRGSDVVRQRRVGASLPACWIWQKIRPRRGTPRNRAPRGSWRAGRVIAKRPRGGSMMADSRIDALARTPIMGQPRIDAPIGTPIMDQPRIDTPEGARTAARCAPALPRRGVRCTRPEDSSPSRRHAVAARAACGPLARGRWSVGPRSSSLATLP